jgi:uncharacterized protein (DUF433 family)
VAVEHILGILADGGTDEELLEDYDWLEPEDIQACFLYVYAGKNTDKKVEQL